MGHPDTTSGSTMPLKGFEIIKSMITLLFLYQAIIRNFEEIVQFLGKIMGCGSSSPAEVAPAEIIEPSPSSDVPSDPKIPTSYRPSIISLQIPNEFGDDVSSDALR